MRLCRDFSILRIPARAHKKFYNFKSVHAIGAKLAAQLFKRLYKRSVQGSQYFIENPYLEFSQIRSHISQSHSNIEYDSVLQLHS